jgi:hypothetical protein
MRTLGGARGSVEEDVEKNEANGSDAMSRADSSVGWLLFDDEESALNIEGSNSRVLSRVRGMFSARRFCSGSSAQVLIIPRITYLLS